MLPDTSKTQKRKWPTIRDTPLQSTKHRQQAVPSVSTLLWAWGRRFQKLTIKELGEQRRLSNSTNEEKNIFQGQPLTPFKACKFSRKTDGPTLVQSMFPLATSYTACKDCLGHATKAYTQSSNSDRICFKDSNGIGLAVFQIEYFLTQSR